MTAPLRLSIQDATPAKRRRRGPVEFDIPAALERADAILSGPCAGYLPRVEGRGRLVHRFILPLDLCKTANALISMVGGRGRGTARMGGAAQAARYKEAVFRMMFLQHPFTRATPLGGRPLLRAIRFSVKETDQESNGLKTAIDMLRVPKPGKWDARKNAMSGGRKGFGFLLDDAPRFVEVASWWEKAPPSKGMGLLEIWSGTP